MDANGKYILNPSIAMEIHEKHILLQFTGHFLQEHRMQKQLSIFVLIIFYYTSVA
jgi:hypothetical protein